MVVVRNESSTSSQSNNNMLLLLLHMALTMILPTQQKVPASFVSNVGAAVSVARIQSSLQPAFQLQQLHASLTPTMTIFHPRQYLNQRQRRRANISSRTHLLSDRQPRLSISRVHAYNDENITIDCNPIDVSPLSLSSSVHHSDCLLDQQALSTATSIASTMASQTITITSEPTELNHDAFTNGSNTNVPNHIAFICDGNTRWSKKHQQPYTNNMNVMRHNGHYVGANRTIELIQYIQSSDRTQSITYLTFYAFSSENWNRSINNIMTLFTVLEQTTKQWYNTLVAHSSNNNGTNQIIFKVIGNIDDERIPNNLRLALRQLEEYTSATATTTESDVDSDTVAPLHRRSLPLTVSVAINYGGRQDIVTATKKMMLQYILDHRRQQTTFQQLHPSSIENDIQQYVSEETLERYLGTSFHVPDPDLLIRTSGEQRVSNFMLWNIAYTELYFTNTLWPDFTIGELNKALLWYAQRERRFGS